MTWSQGDVDSVDEQLLWDVLTQSHAHIPVYKGETFACCWAKMRVIDVLRDISIKLLVSDLRGMRSHGQSLGRTEMGPHDILPAVNKLVGTGIAKVEQGYCQESLR